MRTALCNAACGELLSDSTLADTQPEGQHLLARRTRDEADAEQPARLDDSGHRTFGNVGVHDPGEVLEDVATTHDLGHLTQIGHDEVDGLVELRK